MTQSTQTFRIGPSAILANTAVLTGAMLAGPAAAQLPEGADPGPGVVIQTPGGGVMEIEASQMDSFVDWDSFSIGADNTVKFFLPDGSARILNTVDGPGSFIDGSLWSNGVVYIVNPAGVYFGPDSFVDVGGIYAAAANMTKQDFLDGNNRFTDVQGEVINQGVINAEFAHMIGHRVANHGLIDVEGGGMVTLLAANDEVYLGQMNGKLFVKLDEVNITNGGATGGLVAGGTGGNGPAVENTGTIRADGGQIVLGSGDVYSLAIRNTGSLESEGGQIDLAATSGIVEHDGVIDGAAVSISGDEIHLNSDVAASAQLVLHDPTVIGETLTLNAGGVQALSTIDAAPGTSPQLAMTGSALLMGDIGQSDALGSLTIDGAASLYGDLVRTMGTQTYHGSVTVGSDLLMQGAGVSLMNSLDAATDGEQSLLIDSNAIFHDSVGSVRRLSALTISGAASLYGGDIHTTGTQTYHSAVTLGADTTMHGAGVYFGDTVDAAANGMQALEVQGSAFFSDDVGSVRALSNLNVAGSAGLYGGLVRTSGTQNYEGAVTLGNNLLMQGIGVSFHDSVDAAEDGAQSLLVNSNALFGGAVGETRRLSSLDVSGAANLYGGLVRTTGTQTYHSAVTLGTDTTINGAGVYFGDSVDAAAAGMQSLDVQSSVFFNGEVGGTRALSDLDVAGSAGLYGGLVNTTGTQSYQGNVTVGNDTLVQGSSLLFGSGVDAADEGGQTLSVQGDVTFADAVGGQRALQSLQVDGSALLQGGSVVTTGDQVYLGAVMIDGEILAASLEAGDIRFADQVDGDGSLRLETEGVSDFDGPVGLLVPLVSLETNEAGVTHIGADIHAGTIGFGNVVRLTGDSTLSGEEVRFGSTVDGGYALVINADELLEFGGNVGSADALGMLETNGGGLVRILGNEVRADGDIRFNPDGREEVPAVATIAALGDLEVVSINGNFVMGQGEKLTALGDLEIVAMNGSATVSDLNAMGDMTVMSPQIMIQTREGGPVTLADGQQVEDDGVDFVAGGDIYFLVAPTLIGDGNVQFASGGENPDANETLGGLGMRMFGDVTEGMLVRDGVVLDLVATGPGFSNLAEALAADAEGLAENTAAAEEPFLPTAMQRAALEQLAITVRDLRAEELRSRLAGPGMYDDSPASLEADGELTAVAANRLRRANVSRVLDRYAELFLYEARDEATGELVVEDRMAEIRRSIADAWTDFRRRRPAESRDPQAFVSFLENTPRYSEVLADLRNMQTLFREMENLGLTRSELARVRLNVLARITPADLMPGDLEAVLAS